MRVFADPLVSKPMWAHAFHPYSYVVNNPMNAVDPTGFQAEPIADDSVGGYCSIDGQCGIGSDDPHLQTGVDESSASAETRTHGEVCDPKGNYLRGLNQPRTRQVPVAAKAPTGSQEESRKAFEARLNQILRSTTFFSNERLRLLSELRNDIANHAWSAGNYGIWLQSRIVSNIFQTTHDAGGIPGLALVMSGAGASRSSSASVGLPPFNGKNTSGVMATAENRMAVPLQSGAPDPRYRNYPAAGHVEGKAAIQMREERSAAGVVYHNNPNGTCQFCSSQIPTLLPEGSTLLVMPPIGPPQLFMGNSRTPLAPK
jgi:hypothetical protein